MEQATNTSSSASPTTDTGLLEDIRWAIPIASRYSSLRMTCLPQALAATAMLKARNIPSTLFIGANPSQGGFSGHAWVVAQNVYVTGGSASVNLPVLTRYFSR